MFDQAKANAFDEFRELWKSRGKGVRDGDVFEALDDLVENFEKHEEEERKILMKGAEPFFEIIKGKGSDFEKCLAVKRFMRIAGSDTRRAITATPEFKTFARRVARISTSKKFADACMKEAKL